LASYYTERGETPGVWMGSGMAGIDELNPGDVVTTEQMRALFGAGLHPLAAERQQQVQSPDLTVRDYQSVTRLGAPFKIYQPDVSRFRVEVAKRIAALNQAAGVPADWAVPAADRAWIRTEVAQEFLQGVAGERVTGAAALVSQDRNLVHQVRVLGPARGNGVSHLPGVFGDQPLNNLLKPAPQLLPQLRGEAGRRFPRPGQQPRIPQRPDLLWAPVRRTL
jgi:TrwC relaxase